jgi:hypothetical protein
MFTVFAMVGGGLYYSSDRHRRKELFKMQQQQEAEDKKARWIRELEIRDEEDRAIKERMDRRRKKAEGGVVAALQKSVQDESSPAAKIGAAGIKPAGVSESVPRLGRQAGGGPEKAKEKDAKTDGASSSSGWFWFGGSGAAKPKTTEDQTTTMKK